MNEKTKGSFLKKKTSLTLNKKHSRSHSLVTEATFETSFNVDKRGWLESTPVTPSRSLDTKTTIKLNTATIKKPIIKDRTQKDILGAVSDEDIFKLTELTSRLPEVTNKHHRSRSERGETRKRKEQSQDIIDPVMSDKMITSQQIKRSSFSTPATPTELLDTNEEKRRSWLYKSLIKPYKSKSNKSNSSKSSSNIENTENFEIIKKKIEAGEGSNQRQSIDSEEFLVEQDDILDKWDQERDLEKSYEERPSFNLLITSDSESIHNQLSETEEELEDVEYEEEIIFMFDYFSLPVQVKLLIDSYEHKGKVERKKMMIKYDSEDEEEDKEEDKENIVEYKDLIVGNEIEEELDEIRDIAIVKVCRTDNMEFTKLIQVTMDGPIDTGPLLDLHVSLFGENDHQEHFQDTIESIKKSLEKIESFKYESETFLKDHMETMDSLNLYNYLPRNLSYPNLSSILNEEHENLSRREVYDRNTQSMYGSDYKSRDPFDQRQKEIIILVNTLNKELGLFKEWLSKSEDLVNHVQLDMNDTRNRMETYIKDIPESHYSALKKLEVDIESILSKRTKNPWLDTGYAILSYLLTLFALVVWIVIYILKWGKKVILFPKKLWTSYSDYVVERNKAVKKASMISVSSGGTNDTLFQRTNRRREI